ncbi:MAG: hypothetical protein ABS76_26565 [Pelagibacterium sp. SCN 64-44]|nr:MAG: hypothetical protein ABS76_26565 [Pelagibacterium sp. SCN 64-44]
MTIARNALTAATANYPTWSHPDVIRNAEAWRMIRDCMEGEEAIKDRGEVYLPKLTTMDSEESRCDQAPHGPDLVAAGLVEGEEFTIAVCEVLPSVGRGFFAFQTFLFKGLPS